MGRSSKQRAARRARAIAGSSPANTEHIDFYNYLWRGGQEGFQTEIFLQGGVERRLLFSSLFADWDLPEILLKMIARDEKYDFFMFVFVDSPREGIIVAERESKKIDGSEFQVWRQGEQTIDTDDPNFRRLFEKVFGDKYIERAKIDLALRELFFPEASKIR
jgi:hypothetical protein